MTRRRGYKPGTYPDLTLEEYLAICDDDGWPAVSNTLLRSVRHGPRQCQHRQRFGTEPTKSLLAGSLAHIQILDPARYLRDVAVWDEPVLEPLPALDWRKESPDSYATLCGRYQLLRASPAARKLHRGWDVVSFGDDGASVIMCSRSTVNEGKRACKAHYERTTPRQPKLDADGNPKIKPQNKNDATYKAFLAANPGREIVTPTDIEQAKRIARAVRDNPEARRQLGQIWRTEYTIVWRDPETGTLMKCRKDWLTDPRGPLVTLGELKTCRSAEEGGFTRQAADLEYHCQAAHYRDGFRAHYGEHIETRSVCLAVENGGCHDSTVYTWEEPELAAGRELNEERLQQLLEWRDDYGTGQWPCRREAAHLSFGEHGRGHLLEGDDGDDDGLDWGNRRTA